MVDVRDRRLPGDVEAERDVVALARLQTERPGQALAVELLRGVVLTVAALHLDAGDQAEGDVLDVGGVIATLDVDLTLEMTAGPGVRVGEHRLHRRAAHTQGLHEPLEDHDVLRRISVWFSGTVSAGRKAFARHDSGTTMPRSTR